MHSAMLTRMKLLPTGQSFFSFSALLSNFVKLKAIIFTLWWLTLPWMILSAIYQQAFHSRTIDNQMITVALIAPLIVSKMTKTFLRLKSWSLKIWNSYWLSKNSTYREPTTGSDGQSHLSELYFFEHLELCRSNSIGGRTYFHVFYTCRVYRDKLL